MSIVTIDFGSNPTAKLATLGLKLPQTRGVLALNQMSFLEGPTMVQAHIASRTILQVGAFCSIAGGKLGNVKIGRYCSIAPEVMIGSNEHPVDWLTSSRVTHVADLHEWAQIRGAGPGGGIAEAAHSLQGLPARSRRSATTSGSGRASSSRPESPSAMARSSADVPWW